MSTSTMNYDATDPKKIAAQNRALIANQAGTLTDAAQQRADQGTTQSLQTQDYLGNIENPLASGQGGYNSSELSQIQMTPQQQQQIVTGAGISAGANTAASVGAAERAANAAGGNPLALGAYRARAAQQQGAQAGDAMTQARVGASDAAAQRAENIGQTRIGQQTQGLNYYQGLQGQQNQNAQNAYGQQQQAYGTETSGLTGSANTAQAASQNPSTFDKVMGGVSGALSFLDEGDVTSGTTPAVVGENGPEKVVDLSPRPGLADGGIPSLANTPNSADYLSMVNNSAVDPAFTGTTVNNPDGSATFTPGASQPGAPQQPGFMQRLGSQIKNNFLNQQGQQNAQPQPGQQSPQQPAAPSATNSARTIGQGIGKVASLFLEEGGVASQGKNGIFTRPTRVNLDKNEAVVPLNYRAGAKVRPSFAALPAARARQPYGGARG